MQQFRNDGLVFDVRDGGPPDGEPVVLLHGFPQDSSAFDRMAPLLHDAGLRTLAPDQRGYSPGARPAGRSPYRLRAVTGDVLALLDAAGLESAHVVGHPGRVRTLTSLSTPHPAAAGRAVLTSDQGLRSSYMAAFQVPFLPERLLLARDGAALRGVLESGGLPDDAVTRYVDRMRSPGALSAALAWYRAIPLAARDTVGTVTVPTLHVWSTGDLFLGPAATAGTRRHVTGPYRLEVLEGVPHWIPELAAERTAELVVTHTRSVTAAR
jgi:pimeloyl-ACP methyl ester carboxylesterase